jgi:ABC-2 type transport system permease protein
MTTLSRATARLPASHEARAELRAALAIARKELQVARRYPLNLVNEVLQPLYQFLLPSLLLGATFLVGGRALGFEAVTGTTDVAGYLFLGSLVAGLIGTGFWEIASSFKREMDAGTLEPHWLTPTRPSTIVLGRAISGLAIAGGASVVLLGLGAIFFGASLGPGLLLALPALLIAGLSIVGIGFLVSSLVLLMRDPNFFVDAGSFVYGILTGVAAPILVLPLFVQPISYLLPTTYALDILRVGALGTVPIAPLPLEWLALSGLTIVIYLVGRRAFERTERRMRRMGTLGQH